MPTPEDAYKLNPMVGGADTEALKLRTSILNSGSSLTAASGTTYYVSSNGSDSNNGTSSATPKKSLTALPTLKAGDTVLLERGGVYRLTKSYNCVNGVSYGAYGTGDKPAVYGSPMNFAKGDYFWKPTEVKNIWKIDYNFGNTDIGIIVFNHGEHASERNNAKSELRENGDFWWDNDSQDLYLYCDKGNPGESYYSIEIGPRMILFNFPTNGANNITIDNICFKYSGNFAIRAAIESDNITVSNCEIGWIGGAAQTDGKNVYGNGIEFLRGTQNTVVKNCWIYQIFDTAITIQGTTRASECYTDVTFENNLLEYCGMSGIEWWGENMLEAGSEDATVIRNVAFTGNIIRFTGYGWVKNAIRGARHIQGPWRAYTFTNMSNFTITGNTFDCALGGVYSFPYTTKPDSDTEHIMSGNTYYQRSTADNPTFPNVANQFGYMKTATNQSEFESAIKLRMEKNPAYIEWLD